MNRRAMLASMTALALSPLAMRVTQALAAGANLHAPPFKSALEPSHRTRVAQLAELIIPATDTPGATAAGVPDFIDRIVSEWYSVDERDTFIKGLTELDEFCVVGHQKQFIDSSEAQKVLALQDAERQARSYETTPSGVFAAPEERMPFFLRLKQLTVLGYYTSQVGATTELAFNPAPGRYDGSVDFAEVGRQWSS